jgi:hypothetical protein
MDEKLNLKLTVWMKNREKICKMDEKNEMTNSSILKLLKLFKYCNFLECFWTMEM